MGYFNINSILYNLRKIFKYLSFSLLIVAFVVLALLLMGKDVHAASAPELPSNIKNVAIDYFESSNYDSYFIIYDDSGGGGRWGLILYNYPSNSSGVFYVTPTVSGNYGLMWFGYTDSSNISTEWYTIDSSANISLVSTGITFGEGGGKFRVRDVVSGNHDVYWKPYNGSVELNNIYMQSDYMTFELPYIALPNDSTDNYINGEFGGFMVVAGHDVVSDNILNTLDFFYTDYSEEFTEQNTVVLRLDKNSPYYLNNYQNNNVFIIPKNVIPYLDGHEYYIQLHYVYNEVAYQSDAIQWTTAFSEKAILNDQIRMQDSIDNINGFLNNDKYNNGNIINNMPNSNQYTSPTDSGIDSIFTALYNAFTTNQTQTVRFVIPFTNEQYIDIPSDLVTSRLPQSIIILIQSVYWYVICRYIIKDIANIAEKAKSGEILDGSSDGNIKTDLL